MWTESVQELSKNPLKSTPLQYDSAVLFCSQGSQTSLPKHNGFNGYCINNLLCTQKYIYISLCANIFKTFDHNWDMSLSYHSETKDVRICRG